MSWYLKVIRNYALFRGRARRREYWMFTLVTTIIAVLLTIADFPLGTWDTISFTLWGTTSHLGLLYIAYLLLTLLPTWAVSARRLHDIDRSAWWLLLTFVPIVGSIVLLVFSVLNGTQGANRFGADPKARVPQFA